MATTTTEPTYTKAHAIGMLGAIIALIIAFKMKTGFWLGLFFWIVGSSGGYAIGKLIFED